MVSRRRVGPDLTDQGSIDEQARFFQDSGSLTDSNQAEDFSPLGSLSLPDPLFQRRNNPDVP